MKKAQVSLEYMLVMMALLAFLVLWFASVSKTQGAVNIVFEKSEAKIIADKLAGAINSVCLMGDRNERMITLFSSKGTNISLNGSHLAVNNITRKLICSANGQMEVNGTVFVLVKNENDEIQVNFTHRAS